MSGLSREDRARIQHWIRKLRSAGGSDDPDATALTRALALIDQQEKALEAADEAVGYMDSALYALTQPFAGDPHTAAVGALEVGLDIYRSARATSTKEKDDRRGD